MPFIILGALLIGFTLGLMGSGGSILTVPVLVYLLGHDGKVAIAESLAIVGSIALVTMFPYARSHMVNWRNVAFFGGPGMIGTYVGAWLSQYVPGAVQLTLFAVVMLVAAAFMLRKSKDSKDGAAEEATRAKHTQAFWMIGSEGITVGIMTGLVGVGGGFLIVPALVAFGKLPMRVAIGTSLTVISLQSFSGFFKYLDVLATVGSAVDWPTVAMFIAIGIVGSLVGHHIAAQLDQQLLRRTFAIFLVVMGLFVFGREAPKLVAAAQSPVAIRGKLQTSDSLGVNRPTRGTEVPQVQQPASAWIQDLITRNLSTN